MKTHIRFYAFLLASLVLAAGCSSLPGLRVLTGQLSGGEEAVADTTVSTSELVMADKSGLTDPALIAVADRIEAATQDGVDIIEIRKDLNEDLFTVYMLIPMPNAVDAAFYDSIRRAIELTWQGTMNQSQGSDVLKIEIMLPVPVPTLDNGTSYLGQVILDSQIARSDAIVYLDHRPNTLSDFADLIAQGKMSFTQPDQSTIYEGQPNHPVFMLSGQ